MYVVTLNWNRPEETCACLDSLLATDYADFAIVVCDNHSSEDAIAAIRRWAVGKAGTAGGDFLREHEGANSAAAAATPPARVTLIHTGANLGYAGGMNVGLRYALAMQDADYCWILNNDTEPDPRALGALVARAEADAHIGLCGSTLVEFHERDRIQAFGGAAYTPWSARSRAIGAFSRVQAVPKDPAEVERELAYVNGASILVSRRFLHEVGLMDESYFLYSEEHDWAYRGMQQGFRLGYAPASIVYHMEGATIGTSASGGSELSLFYLYRSKAMFAARHHPHLLPMVCLSLLWDALKHALKGRPRKALAILRGVAAWPSRRRYG